MRHRLRLSDRRLARAVRRCRDLPGQALFQYVDADGRTHRIGSGDVNDWVARSAGRRITAKDFRTWHGSVRALELIAAACAQPVPTCRLPQVLAQVAGGLGNTPAVCRKAYVHPWVLHLGDCLEDAAACQELLGRPWMLEPPRRPWLSLPERQLLALLLGRRPVDRLPLRASTDATDNAWQREQRCPASRLPAEVEKVAVAFAGIAARGGAQGSAAFGGRSSRSLPPPSTRVMTDS